MTKNLQIASLFLFEINTPKKTMVTLGIHSVSNDDPLTYNDLRHCRKRWDYFVSPLLGMQSWTSWLAHRECFILFRGSYSNSRKARLHAELPIDFPTYVNEVPYTRAKDIDCLSAKKIWSKKSLTRELRIYNSRKPRAVQQL